MTITALPTPPARTDGPALFSSRADALLSALPTFVTEANALQADVNAKQSQVASDTATTATNATTASNAATTASAAALAAQIAAGLPPLPGAGQLIKTEGASNKLTGSATLASGRAYDCDTSGGAFSVTLPASPSIGDYVWIRDYSGTFAGNNLTVLRNGQKIEGLTEDLIIDINGLSVCINYIDATKGWVMV